MNRMEAIIGRLEAVKRFGGIHDGETLWNIPYDDAIAIVREEMKDIPTISGRYKATTEEL